MFRLLLGTVWLALITVACTRKDVPPAAAAGRTTSPPAQGRPEEGADRAAPFRRCFPSQRYASAGILVDEGRDALDRGASERAITCADEAIRLAPRLVGALSVRANALAALGRIEEARLAFARALAVDPADPEALLGAAELYVRNLGASRDALEAGLEFALRGARVATARKDKVLAARLALAAGMAENDLGRSYLALPYLEKALAALPADPDVVYERGVAFYELCRFEDAERSFERTLTLAPDDAWTLHQLGLLAERRGDQPRADALLARARKLSPEDFLPDVPVDEAGFRAEVQNAVASLPEAERRSLESVPIDIEDLPSADDLVAVDPPLSPSILGLFRGPAEHEPCTSADGPRCRSIVFYRKNLLRFARDRRELAEQVRVTLLHELGHLHGQDDDELRARGLE